MSKRTTSARSVIRAEEITGSPAILAITGSIGSALESIANLTSNNIIALTVLGKGRHPLMKHL